MLAAALDYIRTKTQQTPEIALVLGSGLGSLAEEAEDPVVISTTKIPGYPHSTVEGHQGRLVFGELIERVRGVRGARIYGITEPDRSAQRCPTIAFTIDGHHPRAQ